MIVLISPYCNSSESITSFPQGARQIPASARVFLTGDGTSVEHYRYNTHLCTPIKGRLGFVRITGPTEHASWRWALGQANPCPGSDPGDCQAPSPARTHLHLAQQTSRHLPPAAAARPSFGACAEARAGGPCSRTAVALQPSAALDQSGVVLLPRNPAPDGGPWKRAANQESCCCAEPRPRQGHRVTG